MINDNLNDEEIWDRSIQSEGEGRYYWVRLRESCNIDRNADFWEDPEEIRKEVLPVIDGVMKGEITDIEEKIIDSDVIGSAFVEPDTTDLDSSQVGYQPMTLPTADFKQLWLEWVELLEADGRSVSRRD